MGYICGMDIVRNGLVFSVDPMNPRSWPGPDSDKVNDLKSSLTGSIFNGTSGSYGSNKSFIFNGDEDYIDFGTSIFTNYLSGTTQFTSGYWCKKVGSNDNMLIGSYNDTGNVGFFLQWYSDNVMYFGVRNNDNTHSSVTLSYENKFFYLVGVFNGSLSNDLRLKIYVNGILTSYNASTAPTSYPTITNKLWIGKVENYAYGSDGDIGLTHIYNRALTDKGVLQNYNALKPRFN